MEISTYYISIYFYDKYSIHACPSVYIEPTKIKARCDGTNCRDRIKTTVYRSALPIVEYERNFLTGKYTMHYLKK
jgi:hypothetical protein